MNPVVVITDDELRQATELAEATLRLFGNARGHYTNNLNSHLRGKLGEIACARWLTTNGVRIEPVFCDTKRMRECDIIASDVATLRLDVKTWDEAHWAGLGRCVAADQLGKLEAKADGVLWCVSSSKLVAGMRVGLSGWSSTADIRAAPRRWTGPPGGRQVDNHQVDPERITPLSELLEALKRG